MTADRKAAIAAYKKREAVSAIYALRSMADGRTWVGHTPDLEAMPNRLWFTLRFGNHRAADLQAAHDALGREGLAIEELERLDGERPLEGAALKARIAHWRGRLEAALL